MAARTRDPEKQAELEAELMGPPLPGAGIYLWGWFLELSQGRGAGGMGGPANLTYPDIEAWARLHRRFLAPWEVDVIKDIDTRFLAVMNES